jgi:perosamine synthetase
MASAVLHDVTAPVAADPDRIAAVAHSVCGGAAALHEPEFAGNEWAYVKDCLDTGWVSTAGRYVEKFEAMLCEITGARNAVATVSGTAALHSALLVAGVRAGDEVIVPSLTFVATANAVSHCGAVPHFADVETATLGLDVARLRQHLERVAKRKDGDWRNQKTGRPIRAIVCMHTFGHPSDLDGLAAVAAEFGLPLIEDAAESLGSTYKGRHTGTFGRLGVLSFNGNKTVTTGGGGAILTDDNKIAARVRHLTTTAKLPHAWAFEHDKVGYNYRMPNINAALGCAQLEQLQGFISRKRQLAQRYHEAFALVLGVAVVAEPSGSNSNFWLNALVLDADDTNLRDAVLTACNERGIGARPAWTPMHQLPMFSDAPRDDLATTESLCRQLINLPSSPRLAGPNND